MLTTQPASNLSQTAEVCPSASITYQSCCTVAAFALTVFIFNFCLRDQSSSNEARIIDTDVVLRNILYQCGRCGRSKYSTDCISSNLERHRSISNANRLLRRVLRWRHQPLKANLLIDHKTRRQDTKRCARSSHASDNRGTPAIATV